MAEPTEKVMYRLYAQLECFVLDGHGRPFAVEVIQRSLLPTGAPEYFALPDAVAALEGALDRVKQGTTDEKPA
jgi:hypothetical protein